MRAETRVPARIIGRRDRAVRQRLPAHHIAREMCDAEHELTEGEAHADAEQLVDQRTPLGLIDLGGALEMPRLDEREAQPPIEVEIANGLRHHERDEEALPMRLEVV